MIRIVSAALASMTMLLATDLYAQEITKLPILIQPSDPVFPETEQARGIEASVVLWIDIDSLGAVSSATISESGGASFDQAALVAALGLRFEPAEIDGVPSPVRISYRYNFTLMRLPDLGATTTTTTTAAATRIIDDPRPAKPIPESGYGEEVTVRRARLSASAVNAIVDTREGRLIPGVQGDTLKVVQTLPGVARPQAGSGSVVVWGAAPKETKILVDGLEVPLLYHLGGVRSTLSSDLVSAVELVPGAYGAAYGRGLGGLILVTTRDLPRVFSGAVSVDLLDASLFASVPLGSKVRASIAGRFGWLDRVLTSFIDDDAADLFPIPKYGDYQGKVSLDLGDKESLSLLLLGSHDRLARTLDAANPSERRADESAVDFNRLSLHYANAPSSAESIGIAAGISKEAMARRSAFGAVPASLNVDALRYSLRAHYHSAINDTLNLELTFDAQGLRSRVVRSGSFTIPAREGDIFVFGRPPGDDVNLDNFDVEILALAPALALEWALGPLTLRSGIRLDIFAIDGQRLLPRLPQQPEIGFTRLHHALAPRFDVSWAATENVRVLFATGVYSQAPEPEDLSAVFGATDLAIQRAIHGVIGVAATVPSFFDVEVTLFAKHLDRLVARSPSAAPPLAGTLTQDGIGRNVGAQILLRRQLSQGLFGWVSYALSRSERRDAPGGSWRLFDFDQTHVLTLVASYEWRDWTFGSRLRYATGAPRTPVTRAFIDLRGDQFQPAFGPQNSVRLGSFLQLDLRVERTFRFAPLELALYLDLQNLTFRENVEELAYDFAYATQAPITGLPFLGVLGGRLSW